MGRPILWIILSLFHNLAWGNPPVSSESRLLDEGAEEAFQRHFGSRDLEWGTAWDEKRPLEDTDLTRIREVTSEKIQEIFLWTRDLRFLETENRPGFARRISWLYPDSGCFDRAEFVVKLAREIHDVQFSKLFAFGRLEAATPNSPDGKVRWWYHVAPAARVGERVYVLDPTLDPKEPMTLERWMSAVIPDLDGLSLAVCAPSTYMPADSCDFPDRVPESELLRSQRRFLDLEWERRTLMGDPQRDLGAFPPWLQ
jgi:hypothetical protein